MFWIHTIYEQKCSSLSSIAYMMPGMHQHIHLEELWIPKLKYHNWAQNCKIFQLMCHRRRNGWCKLLWICWRGWLICGDPTHKWCKADEQPHSQSYSWAQLPDVLPPAQLGVPGYQTNCKASRNTGAVSLGWTLLLWLRSFCQPGYSVLKLALLLLLFCYICHCSNRSVSYFKWIRSCFWVL